MKHAQDKHQDFPDLQRLSPEMAESSTQTPLNPTNEGIHDYLRETHHFARQASFSLSASRSFSAFCQRCKFADDGGYRRVDMAIGGCTVVFRLFPLDFCDYSSSECLKSCHFPFRSTRNVVLLSLFPRMRGCQKCRIAPMDGYRRPISSDSRHWEYPSGAQASSLSAVGHLTIARLFSSPLLPMLYRDVCLGQRLELAT